MALIVKKSKLPNAGKGLFTTKAIKKDSKVIEYKGEIITWKEYDKRVASDKDGYLFYINRQRCIDAYPTPQYKARYANDANGLVRIKGVKNNCEYNVIGDKCYIVSVRDIKAGEEIFVDYTKGYWDTVRDNIKNGFEKDPRKSR
jgi:SET domain-containing protein